MIYEIKICEELRETFYIITNRMITYEFYAENKEQAEILVKRLLELHNAKLQDLWMTSSTTWRCNLKPI